MQKYVFFLKPPRKKQEIFKLSTNYPISSPSKSRSSHRFTQIFSFTILPYKSHADCADDADFLPFYFFTLLPLKVPQISQIHTDFFFYLFTFKSHADCADDADFLLFYLFTFLPLNSSFTLKSSPGGPIPQNMARALMPRQP